MSRPEASQLTSHPEVCSPLAALTHVIVTAAWSFESLNLRKRLVRRLKRGS